MEITANDIQLVSPNNNVIFTDTIIGGCPSIIHRNNSGIIKLRGLTATQCRARFRASFGANMAIPAGQAILPISLALTLDGEPVATTQMIVTPTLVNNYFNVASDIYIDVPIGCCGTLGVRNTSTIPVNVQNANLIIERVA